jgi:hypothetical protein
MSVNSVNGTITVSKLKPVGNYTIKIIGTLPNLFTTHLEIFNLIITPNSPP